MQAQQLSVKFFLDEHPEGLQDQLIGVFHRWIRDGRLGDRLLIDVADYRHVHHGPGVMLIGHEAHWAMDEADGRIGLVYNRKRDAAADVGERLTQALGEVLQGCRALEDESELGLSFKGNEVEIRILSRLMARNDEQTMAAFESQVAGPLARLYPQGAAITQFGTERDPFGVRVQTEETVDVDTLVARFCE